MELESLLSVTQLQDLMNSKSLNSLNELGGVTFLANQLGVNLKTGLSEGEGRGDFDLTSTNSIKSSFKVSSTPLDQRFTRRKEM